MQYKILKKSVEEDKMSVLCELDGHKFNEAPTRLDSRRILNDLQLDDDAGVVILLVEAKTVYSDQDRSKLCTFVATLDAPKVEPVELNKEAENDVEDHDSRGRRKRTKDKLQST